VATARLTAEHWPQIEATCAEGISTGRATFESAPPKIIILIPWPCRC
jgi:hypothetical protein